MMAHHNRSARQNRLDSCIPHRTPVRWKCIAVHIGIRYYTTNHGILTREK